MTIAVKVEGGNVSDEQEQHWMQGRRSAYVSLLQTCLGELGYKGDEAQKVLWIMEREQAIAKLREICAAHGDNNWDNELHLADIIDKHLFDHLG